jgi:hypothetical protein
VNNEGSTGFKFLLPSANTGNGSYDITFDVQLNSGSLTGCSITNNNQPDSYDQQTLASGSNTFPAIVTIGMGGLYFRTNTTAVADVSITNLTLTQTTADGHVTTWYDQSGNTNHATQGTSASQPKIVSGGALVVGGLDFDGAQKLENPFPSGFSGKEQSHFVKFTPNSNFGYLVEFGGGIGAARSLSVEPYLRFNAVTQDYDSTVLSGDSLLSMVCPDAPTTIDGYDLYYQGSLLTPDSLSGGTLASVTSSDITIGDGAYIGKISEAILYNSDQSANRLQYEYDIANYYGIEIGIDTYKGEALFNSRHAELVAIARKAIEEIDAAVLLANWPGALSPTKIKPTGTERDNDAEHRVTKLSYDLQFRIT